VIRPLIVAIVAAIAYVLLGNAVSHVPPGPLDVAGRALVGEAPGFAYVLTESCLWPVLVVIGAAALLVAWRLPGWRTVTLTMVVTTVVAWQVSDALKNAFHRARPPYWIVHQELSYSYSSGHALFATVVYGAWAAIIWRSGLPLGVRAVVTPLLALWACGVVWSRLALGAHYITDLMGGVLLGSIALACAAIWLQAVSNKQAAATAAR
jgi:undecaprenyl-diphosphatase